MRSYGVDFEKSPCYTTENLPPSFVTSDCFTEHVKPHNVIWNWSFTWHASTIATFSFLFFPPMDFHLTDRQERRGGGERKRKKGPFQFYFCMEPQKSLQLNTTQTEKRSGKRLSGAWQERSAVGGQVKAALEDKQFTCYRCRRENSSSLH